MNFHSRLISHVPATRCTVLQGVTAESGLIVSEGRGLYLWTGTFRSCVLIEALL